MVPNYIGIENKLNKNSMARENIKRGNYQKKAENRLRGFHCKNWVGSVCEKFKAVAQNPPVIWYDSILLMYCLEHKFYDYCIGKATMI